MESPTFFAGYHKLVFRPSKTFTTSEESVNEITTTLFNIPLSQFEKKSSGKSRQWEETFTYHRFIDLTYKNTSKHGTCLDRVTIQGLAFDHMPFSITLIQQYLETQSFQVIEVHSKVDVPKTLVSFQTIKDHFTSLAYVAPGCKLVVPMCDPSNQYAETYYAGKRATHGKRVAFYEAGKVHDDLKDVTRMELQLFGRDAHAFFIDGLWDDFRRLDLTERTFRVIIGHLEFKTLTGHENRSRRKIAPWWGTTIGNYTKINLPRTFRNPPDRQRQKAALKSVLYEKRQKLGEESFVEAMVEFAQEFNLTTKLVGVAAGLV